MENRDKDKMNQRSSSMESVDSSRNTSDKSSKSDSSASFGQNIGRSENSLNEPSSRVSGSVGSSGMKESNRSDNGKGSHGSDR